MDDKLWILESLKIKKGFGGASNRNVSPGSAQKQKLQHSKSAIIERGTQKKNKNVFELPKNRIQLFKLFKNLNAGNKGSSSSSGSSSREENPSEKICDKMDSNEPHVMEVENNNNCKTESSFSFGTHGTGSNDNFHNSINNNNTSNKSKDKTDNLINDIPFRKELKGEKCNLMNAESENGEFMITEKKKVLDSTHNDIVSNNSIAIKNIPATVQEWINCLPLKNSSQQTSPQLIESKDASHDVPNAIVTDFSPTLPAKLSREASLQSSSSLDSLLDARKPDPVEIFLNLGFGGVPGVDMEICRIPKRFLVPSKCKGGDWNEFLRREFLQAQNFECSTLGFRGLSGPSYRRPSAIVANIMEKLRERSMSQSYSNRTRFSMGKRQSSERSTDNKLSPEFQSVLSADSRQFLQNQGKISPEVPRRRIIFGQKSFAFGRDGEFVEVESTSAKNVADSPSKVPAADVVGQTGNGVEERAGESFAENLLKYRRGSLQKQKKVEEDEDGDDDDDDDDGEEEVDVGFEAAPEPPFYVDDDDDKPEKELEPPEPETVMSAKKASNKIPRRFLSSSNLKSFDADASLSEIMRREIEKEIRCLSQKIKDISDQELVSVLRQVKELSSALESTAQVSFEV